MKKLVTLAIAGVCALAFLAVADAGTTLRENNNVVKSTNINTHNSSVYANKADAHGALSASVTYIYSGDVSRNAEVMYALKQVLGGTYANLVPAAGEGYGIAASTGYGTPTAAWKSAEYVARNVLPGRVAGMSTGSSGAATSELAEMNKEARERLAKEEAAEAANLAAYNERKAEWDAAEAAKAEEDPEYVVKDFPEEYVSTYKDEVGGVISSNNQITVDKIGATTTAYKVIDGVMTQVDTTDVAREKISIYTEYANKFVSPLVLDVTGNGVLQASNGQHMPGHEVVKDNIILADFYGDGFEIGLEWVGPQDGLLVAPKADGTVDMSCLFGTAGGYDNGYEKLSLYDTNNDKVVKGEELNGLSIWQDANRNGIAEAGEVKTVQDLGITEISLNANDMYVSSFKMNGKTNKMWDWWPNAVELVKVAAK